MGDHPSRLDETVKNEALLWGNDVAHDYHGIASTHMDNQWNDILKIYFDKYPFNLRRSIDFAAGFGRNTRKILEAGADHVTMLDVNPDCVAQLEKSLPAEKTKSVLISGYNLNGIHSAAHTFLYTFDAMVHFDLEIVIAYLPEFSRVLEPGAYALVHHSNYSARPGGDFRENPHWRNFMHVGIFKHVAIRSGFEVVEQNIFSWGEAVNSDCISILRKR